MLEFPIEFFDDEVRDGFYVPSIMKHNWAAQMEIVHTVDEICRRNNIKYFLFAGSLIGAVRHGGFIPWDDDMDICMLRKDYKRFLKALDREKPDTYIVRNYYNEKEYREVFTRLLDDDGIAMHPDFWTKRHGFVCNSGIDVFPLDYIPSNEQVRNDISHNIMHLHYIIAKYDEEGLTPELEQKLIAIEREFRTKIVRDDTIPQQMYLLMDELLESVKRADSKAVHIFLRWAQNEAGKGIPIDVFENSLDMNFEMTKFMVPYKYDKILKSMFGQYMNSIRVCDIHNYPWYQKILDDVKRSRGLSDYPFLKELLPVSDRRAAWEQKMLGELNEVFDLFGKASALAEQSLSNGDTETGNVLLSKCNELAVKAETIETRLKASERERVIFLTWKSEYWKSLEPYYYEEVSKGSEVLVVPVPFTRLTENRERTEEILDTKYFPEDLVLTDFSSIDYDEVRIARIYTQNIYDDQNGAVMLRSFFHTTNIRNFTDELIYVPWFTLDRYENDDIRAKYVSQFFMRTPGIVAVDKIYLSADQVWLREKYIDELTEWAGEDTREIWSGKIQIVAFDEENEADIVGSNVTESVDSRKRMLYYISSGTVFTNHNEALDKLKRNISVFENASDKIKVILFVEDDFIKNIEKCASELKTAFSDILDEYAGKEWCELIKSDKGIDINDYQQAGELLDMADAFYGDSGVLMHLYDIAGKPVMIQNNKL